MEPIMPEFSSTIHIDAPRSQVWDAIADLGGVQTFHPGVTKSYYTSEQTEGVGASRRCELKPVGSVDEHAIDWRPGKSVTLDVRPGPKGPPFKRAQGRMWVDEDSDGTRAGLEFEYQLKFGPIGLLLDRLIIRRQFEKMLPAVLRGLKNHVEGGEISPHQSVEAA